MAEKWNCPDCGAEITEKKRRGPHLSSCRRSKTAKYRYLHGDTKHPYELKQCQKCGKEDWMQVRNSFCSTVCSQSGENNSSWRGEDAGYVSKHARVYRLRGKAISCVWGCIHARYEWANLTGNYDDTEDYASMCSECHSRFDSAVTKCFDKTCKRGHVLNNSTMYVNVRNGKEVRSCKRCAKDRAKLNRRAASSDS